MEHIFGKGAASGKGGPKPPPSRGVVAGVKADYERLKQTGDYDPKNPNGTGMAWTHNFLNQKPWHPMSFKNRMKVWEHEQDKVEGDKIKEKAQAEFDAEQEYLKTLSYLSADEQRRYREVQSVSFMYQKPPGLDAALARDAEAEKKKAAQQAVLEAGPSAAAAAAAGGSAAGATAGAAGAGESGAVAAAPAAAAAAAAGPDPAPSRAAMVDRLREDPFASMLAAQVALRNNPKFALAQPRDVGVFGGIRPDAHNQQLLKEDPVELDAAAQDGSAELEFLLGLPPDQQLKALRRIAKKRKKEEEERKLREAEAVLRAAGYDLTAMEGGGGGGGSKSSKHKKKRSKSKGHKHKEEDKSRKSKKRRRGSDSGSDSTDSDSR
ncbi:hypothetical protein HXX76_010328 [Chlamydomonas incerta]|uniref:CBF1-interacting co-repressor CIR N-terminal domain-containing protein n=1 Tax=Chlamydomonas incerta TaxID=51695 RepID=A0A835T0J8_CHLIN|nr:hypothetical protein HXX76_010328 [Chlamydomonas incerta]|eukprot:KAG2430230.1 hypothetical protein HXX76_010328 [Chlamydomonas incerta]